MEIKRKPNKLEMSVYNRMATLYKKGATKEDLVKKFKVTKQQVGYILDFLQVPPHRKKVPEKYCVICSKSFKYNNFKCCSRECKKIYLLQKKSILIEKNKYICMYCNKKFKEPLAYKNGNKFYCTKCNTKRCKKYRQTKGGKEAIYRSVRRSDKKYPEKVKARAMLHRALADNKIIKPKKCSSCGKRKKLDAHHPDYKKPLDVLWVCRQCHAHIHNKKIHGFTI